MNLQVAKDIERRISRLATVEIKPDLSGLTKSDLEALVRLLEAGKYFDAIYLKQAYSENPHILEELSSSKDPEAKRALRYFALNMSPWDQLSDYEPYIGDKKAPRGSGFYPEDMTQEEFETWVRSHPANAEKFRSLYTVIQRKKGELVAVPYSVEYRGALEPAARLLREAADLTANKTLAKFLRGRAEALLTDDYFHSELDWMDLDSDIDPTIGPYEVYADGLFGYKASYEFFLNIRDQEASKQLELFTRYLPEMEMNLPIPDEYKNTRRGSESPIRVVNQILAAGSARSAVRASAYNLPNDERVREKKGSKKILLKNIMDAKFQNATIPIAHRVIAKDQLGLVTSRAYFYQVLFHELSHGLGPGIIPLPDGELGEVRLALKDLYSPLEEAKADVMGIWNILLMISRGVLPRELEDECYITYVAGHFRALRFGFGEAHGRGVLTQFNYLLDKRVIQYDEQTGRYSADLEIFREGLRSLLYDFLMIQAKGEYEAAKAFLEKFGKSNSQVQETLRGLVDIPVDIIPIFNLPFKTSWDINSLAS